MTLQGLHRLHFTTVNTFTLEMENSNPLAIHFGSLFIYFSNEMMLTSLH